MKKRIIIISSIIIIIGLIIGWKSSSNYSTTLKENWDFTLPTESHYSQIYSQNSENNFHGDSIRYHVFSYQNDKPIENMFKWQSLEQKTIYYDSYHEAIHHWLNEIDVPLEKRPTNKDYLYWYQSQNNHNEIIVLWDKNQQKLYIVESFL